MPSCQLVRTLQVTIGHTASFQQGASTTLSAINRMMTQHACHTVSIVCQRQLATAGPGTASTIRVTQRSYKGPCCMWYMLLQNLDILCHWLLPTSANANNLLLSTPQRLCLVGLAAQQPEERSCLYSQR
jgi:hypothetical protein